VFLVVRILDARLLRCGVARPSAGLPAIDDEEIGGAVGAQGPAIVALQAEGDVTSADGRMSGQGGEQQHKAQKGAGGAC